jgi:hypothetical protein
MARKNIEKVIAAWNRAAEAYGDSKHTCYTDGTSVWSYRTCIAVRTSDNRKVVLNKTKYSLTTTMQQRAVEVEVLRRWGSGSIIYVDDLDRGATSDTLLQKAGLLK